MTNFNAAPSSAFSKAKRLVPPFLKRAARNWFQNVTLGRAIREVGMLPLGELPTREMLENLQRGWANDGFAARTDYLEAVSRTAVTTAGPILECGSGLTTILLGLLAGRRGVYTWSLEHFPEWQVRVGDVLERFAIPNVQVCAAPLRRYGDFSWYEPPQAVLPDEFRLVICDGPPGSTAGGRYGLMPVLRERLRSGTVILLDDATRAGEREVLCRWSAEKKLSISTDESNKSFAVVTIE